MRLLCFHLFLIVVAAIVSCSNHSSKYLITTVQSKEYSGTYADIEEAVAVEYLSSKSNYQLKHLDLRVSMETRSKIKISYPLLGQERPNIAATVTNILTKSDPHFVDFGKKGYDAIVSLLEIGPSNHNVEYGYGLRLSNGHWEPELIDSIVSD